MKRSNEPVAWALFGAGGMLSAIFAPVLIYVTGIGAPTGYLLAKQTMSYAHMLAFTRNPVGKIAVLAVISLFLFHGAHRIRHSLHDLGIRTGPVTRGLFFGGAAAATVLAAALLLKIGF